MVREPEQDDVFRHLRKQDEEIRVLQDQIKPIVEVIKNLEGFAAFCSRWGRRINLSLKWLAAAGPALVLLWQWLSSPIEALFKTKNGG